MRVLVGARGDGWQINVSRKRWKIDLGIVSGQGSLGAWVMGMRPWGYLLGRMKLAEEFCNFRLKKLAY